jgi:hypothetical protein
MKKPKKKEAVPATPEEVEELCDEMLVILGDKYRAARQAGNQAEVNEIWDDCRLWMGWRREARAAQHPGSIGAIILAARRNSLT